MPWPEDRHDIFPGDERCLTYLHRSDRFPIGQIGDATTPANDARLIVEQQLGDLGPIVHLALAPHEKHNIVVSLDTPPTEHTTVVGDAVIVPRTMDQPFSIETFVGDCAVVIAESASHFGFIHVGRLEIVDGVLGQFLHDHWKVLPMAYTSRFYVGPVLSAQFHCLPDTSLIKAEGLGRYLTNTTATLGIQGFSVLRAILDNLTEVAIKACRTDHRDIKIAEVCPYAALLANPNSGWASHRYYTDREEKSPRDCAFFHYRGV